MAACSVATPAGEPADDFPSSLHATRAGKNHWYGAANGGFEKWTGVGMGQLGCTERHVGKPVEGRSEAIRRHNETGVIRFTRWNAETRSLAWIRGVAPLPEDHARTLQMAFLAFGGSSPRPRGKAPGPRWTRRRRTGRGCSSPARWPGSR